LDQVEAAAPAREVSGNFRRKAIYEALHPEFKHGGNAGGRPTILLHGRQGVHRGNCRLDRKGGTHAGKPLAASSTRESRACGQQ